MRRAGLWIAAVAVGLVAGCAGGPSAQTWAGQVCQALTPWRSQIEDLNRQAAAQLAGATTAAQTRDGLVELVSGGEAASEAARAAVAGAGVPDVDGGDAVARGIVTALAGTRDAYGRARVDLQGLSTADETAFYNRVTEVMARLNDEYRASAVDTTTLNSPDLQQAFAGTASCR